MKNIEIKIGDKIGKLTILEKIHKKSFLAQCECGKKVIRCQSRLYKSCGCWEGKTHGMKNTRFYGIWKGMQGRCYCKSNSSYKRTYGKKLIKSIWKDNFPMFKTDMYDSYIDHVKKFGEKQTTIDRIDNNQGYSKDNCKWSTYVEQTRNRSNSKLITINGITKSPKEWAESINASYVVFMNRIYRGWDLSRLLDKPTKSRKGIKHRK